jgi:hypothetical protein
LDPAALLDGIANERPASARASSVLETASFTESALAWEWRVDTFAWSALASSVLVGSGFARTTPPEKASAAMSERLSFANLRFIFSIWISF